MAFTEHRASQEPIVCLFVAQPVHLALLCPYAVTTVPTPPLREFAPSAAIGYRWTPACAVYGYGYTLLFGFHIGLEKKNTACNTVFFGLKSHCGNWRCLSQSYTKPQAHTFRQSGCLLRVVSEFPAVRKPVPHPYRRVQKDRPAIVYRSTMPAQS